MPVGLQIFLTAISAVAVNVIGNFVVGTTVTPLLEMRRLVAQIAYDLRFYSNVFSNPVDLSKADIDKVPNEYEDAQTAIRDHAIRLSVQTRVVPRYAWWASLGMVPPPNDIQEASACLVGISNALWGRGGEAVHRLMNFNLENEEKIRKRLRIQKT